MVPPRADPPRLGHYREYPDPPPLGVDHARKKTLFYLSYASTEQKPIINLSWRSSFVSAFAVGLGETNSA